MSSEPDDLLSKADALMARHHPGRATAAHYPDIPILDEIVESPPAENELPLLTEYVVTAPLNEEQTAALAASISASVLAELQPRIGALIDERLRDGAAPTVDRLLRLLRGSLKLIAQDILGDAVRRAVDAELERRNPGG
jgi:hypothetical protein